MNANEILVKGLGNRKTYSYSRLLMLEFVKEVWNEAVLNTFDFKYENSDYYNNLVFDYVKNIHKYANVTLDVEKLIEYVFTNNNLTQDQKNEFRLFVGKLMFN
jgi:hypothetical protein